MLSAERVPKSKKLLKLQVDTGTDQRTIVAGIAEAYEPEALVGRTMAIVFNLKPAKLMGIESNGMVLAGSPEGGKPLLVGFDEPLRQAPGSGSTFDQGLAERYVGLVLAVGQHDPAFVARCPTVPSRGIARQSSAARPSRRWPARRAG